MTNCDKAIEILSATNDGRDLYQSERDIDHYGRNGDGWQLALIQDAVNANLTALGERLFDCLHRQVVAGDYKYPLAEFTRKFVYVARILHPLSPKETQQ